MSRYVFRDGKWLDGLEPSSKGVEGARPAFIIPKYMTAEHDRVNSASMHRLKEYQNTPEFRKKMLSGEREEMKKGDYEE